MLSFQKLDVYQCAIEFVALATDIAAAIPRGYGALGDQLRRAAFSVPLNMVMYRIDGKAVWASSGREELPGIAIMESDGNFAIYSHSGHNVWSSGTHGHFGSRLVMQDDGNLVIYRPDGEPVRASNTVGA